MPMSKQDAWNCPNDVNFESAYLLRALRLPLLVFFCRALGCQSCCKATPAHLQAVHVAVGRKMAIQIWSCVSLHIITSTQLKMQVCDWTCNSKFCAQKSKESTKLHWSFLCQRSSDLADSRAHHPTRLRSRLQGNACPRYFRICISTLR